MPASLQDVCDLVRQGFPDADLNELIEEGQRVIGTIRWDGFCDLSAQARGYISQLDSPSLARNHVIQGISRLLEARKLTHIVVESSKIPYDPE